MNDIDIQQFRCLNNEKINSLLNKYEEIGKKFDTAIELKNEKTVELVNIGDELRVMYDLKSKFGEFFIIDNSIDTINIVYKGSLNYEMTLQGIIISPETELICTASGSVESFNIKTIIFKILYSSEDNKFYILPNFYLLAGKEYKYTKIVSDFFQDEILSNKTKKYLELQKLVNKHNSDSFKYMHDNSAISEDILCYDFILNLNINNIFEFDSNKFKIKSISEENELITCERILGIKVLTNYISQSELDHNNGIFTYKNFYKLYKNRYIHFDEISKRNVKLNQLIKIL